MNTYNINKIQLPDGDICNLRDTNAKTIAEYKTLTNQEIATFDDGIQNSTLKNYSIKIEPKQDLHGYDKPWIGGAGKNLLPAIRNNEVKNGVTFSWNEDGTLSTSGTASASIRYDIFGGNSFTLQPGTYKIWGIDDSTVSFGGASIQLRKIINSSADANVLVKVGGNDSPKTFTVAEAIDVYPVAFISATGLTKAANFTWYPMLIEATENDEYVPYSNICPITGWTGAKVTVSPTTDEADGTTYSITFPTEAGTVYGGTLIVNEDGSGMLIVDKVCDTFTGSSNENWELRSDIGSRKHFRGTLSNTYIDLISPSLHGHGVYNTLSNSIPLISDEYDSTYTNSSIRLTTYTTASNYIFALISSDVGATTLAEWKSWLGNNPLQVCYPLAAPLTYTLTANQLTILLGTNHILADAGNITITYPTNLKGYIDNINNKCITKSQQTQAVFYGLAASAGDSTQKSSSNAIGIYTDDAKGYILHMLGLDAIIGNYELDEYADKNYSVDQLFMMKGKLYKATSLISQGESIVPNTNCVQTTILENLTNQAE